MKLCLMMIRSCALNLLLPLVITLWMTSSGSALQLPVPSHQRQFRWSYHRTECYEKDKGLSNYEETGASEKGIVSALTNLVNLFLERKQDKKESSPIIGKYSIDYHMAQL